MANLLIDNVTAGMVLADDVLDRQGRPLLKAGVELTDKHIKVFKTWGINHVNIVGKDTEPALQEIIDAHPEWAEEAEQVVSCLFRHVDQTHPLFESLIPLSAQHYIQTKAAQQ